LELAAYVHDWYSGGWYFRQIEVAHREVAFASSLGGL
jgi:hypothetical protein